MKRIEQIRDVYIDVTKEDIMKNFTMRYKWNHDILTANEYVKEILKRIAIIVGMIFIPVLLLFLAKYDIYALLLVVPVLLSEFTFIVWLREVLCFDFDFRELNKQYEHFLDMCNILQRSFATNDIIEILNTEEVYKESYRLQLLHDVINDKIVVHRNKNGYMYAYNKESEENYSLEICWKDKYKEQYALIIGISSERLESIEVKPNALRKQNKTYQVVHTDGMLDIGLCMETDAFGLPELIRCSSKTYQPRSYYGSVSKVNWICTGVFLTESDWDEITCDKSNEAIIESLGLNKNKEENTAH